MSRDLREALAAVARRRVPDVDADAHDAWTPHMADVVRRRRARRAVGQAGGALVVAVGVIALGGALVPDDARGPTAAPETEVVPVAQGTAAPTGPVPCAELPTAEGEGTDYEGWWSSAPADADATVLRDPAEWPVKVRDHPRTVVVDTTTGQVVSAWDRLSCQEVTSTTTAPAPDAAWPPDSVVVLDAGTGEVVDSFPKPPS